MLHAPYTMSRFCAAPALALALSLLAGCEERIAEQPAKKTAPAAPEPSESAPLPPPPADAGAWTDSLRFRMRVLGAAPCDPPEQRGGRYRLGVRVEIAATEKATLSAVLVTPQAASLVKDGKVFQAELKPRSTPNCEGPLTPVQLTPGKAAHGVFIFEAPNDSYFRGAVFRFQPPRWGGEHPLEVNLPECFGDDCADAGAP